MNYGGIGWVIGHELAHAFDNRDLDLGDQCWDVKTKTEYTRRVQCIVDQYGNYTSERIGLKVELHLIYHFQTDESH